MPNKSKSVKVFVVEDDPMYLLDLERIIDELGYQWVGSAQSGEEALENIPPLDVDIVLMDIDLKGHLDGIEVAIQLMQAGLPVVFLTAYEDEQIHQAALQASHFGYIVKPVSKFTLQTVVEAAVLKLNDARLSSEIYRLWQEKRELNSILYIKNANELFRVRESDILYLEADGNYTIVHSKERRLAIKMSLKEVKKRLSPLYFVQIHRSYVVRLNYVDRINTVEGELSVGENRLPIGTKFKPHLMDRLNKM